MQPRRSRGRPAHQPTDKSRQTVEVLAGFSLSTDQIALVLEISAPTLLLHYRPELERGKATVEAKLAGNLLRIAGGSGSAALKAITFALQTRFGWSMKLAFGDDGESGQVLLGKKEAAQLAARTAGQGSDWGDDLDPARPN